MYSLESPHRGDSNEYTQYTIFKINKKITRKYLKSAVKRFFPRDSRTSLKQQRAISVGATEVLLYIHCTIRLTERSFINNLLQHNLWPLKHVPLYILKAFIKVFNYFEVQLNVNGSNTFGTMKMCSRYR